MQDSGDAPDRELTLFEYGTCRDPAQAAWLYEHRERLQPYLKRERGWLTLSFDEDYKPCIRAAGYVGVLPFSDKEGMSHLLLIAPKGCDQQNADLGLLRFLELLAFDDGGTPPKDIASGWEGQLGPHRFLLFLARHYASLLKELCRRDFRSYYRAEEDKLRGHIRGRLHLSGYARLAVQGKQHILPCRWDEFTVDNWDNRILWAAARRLKDVAATLDPRAAQLVWDPFQHLLSWFSPVAEVPITASDFHRSRLGRTSRYYRRALVWARLLLQGSDLPTAGGQVPPLVLDAPAAFERFAEVVAGAALPDAFWHPHFQQECSFPFLTGQQSQSRKPDILLSGPEGLCAVGDAKYKDVLERAANKPLGTAKEVLEVGIQPADWNQLYVYMRMKGASFGFFVVPFWNAVGDPFEWLDDFQFAKNPCDGTVRVAVLALNLLKPLKTVKQAAATRLCAWLSEMQKEAK